MIQRIFDSKLEDKKHFSELFHLVKQNLINQGLVFLVRLPTKITLKR